MAASQDLAATAARRAIVAMITATTTVTTIPAATIIARRATIIAIRRPAASRLWSNNLSASRFASQFARTLRTAARIIATPPTIPATATPATLISKCPRE
jgi:hypothetical protein